MQEIVFLLHILLDDARAKILSKQNIVVSLQQKWAYKKVIIVSISSITCNA